MGRYHNDVPLKLPSNCSCVFVCNQFCKRTFPVPPINSLSDKSDKELAAAVQNCLAVKGLLLGALTLAGYTCFHDTTVRQLIRFGGSFCSAGLPVAVSSQRGTGSDHSDGVLVLITPQRNERWHSFRPQWFPVIQR